MMDREALEYGIPACAGMAVNPGAAPSVNLRGL
jgi:hypothetical protein